MANFRDRNLTRMKNSWSKKSVNSCCIKILQIAESCLSKQCSADSTHHRDFWPLPWFWIAQAAEALLLCLLKGSHLKPSFFLSMPKWLMWRSLNACSGLLSAVGWHKIQRQGDEVLYKWHMWVVEQKEGWAFIFVLRLAV